MFGSRQVAGTVPSLETPAPDHHPEATMRARSSIPAMLCSVLVAAAACDSSSGPQGPGPSILLVVAPSAATIKGGGRLQLNLTARDDEGHSTTPSEAVWISSDPRVATVARDGVVTGVDAGRAEIKAYWNGTNGLSTVTVTGPAGRPGCGNNGGGGNNKPLLKAICVAK